MPEDLMIGREWGSGAAMGVKEDREEIFGTGWDQGGKAYDGRKDQLSEEMVSAGITSGGLTVARKCSDERIDANLGLFDGRVR
jgi:hypothetical protein